MKNSWMTSTGCALDINVSTGGHQDARVRGTGSRPPGQEKVDAEDAASFARELAEDEEGIVPLLGEELPAKAGREPASPGLRPAGLVGVSEGGRLAAGTGSDLMQQVGDLINRHRPADGQIRLTLQVGGLPPMDLIITVEPGQLQVSFQQADPGLQDLLRREGKSLKRFLRRQGEDCLVSWTSRQDPAVEVPV